MGERLRLLALAVLVATASGLLILAATWGPSPEQAPKAEAVMQITGHQWYWEFSVEWPEGTLIHSVGQAAIPSGIRVRVLATSADLVYSIYIPSLSVKIDAIPGHVSVFVFDAIPPGYYAILNAEFAGSEGVGMTATLHVVAT